MGELGIGKGLSDSSAEEQSTGYHLRAHILRIYESLIKEEGQGTQIGLPYALYASVSLCPCEW